MALPEPRPPPQPVTGGNPQLPVDALGCVGSRHGLLVTGTRLNQHGNAGRP